MKLQVTPCRRYLMCEDGSPFFFLGDTAWELFHRLDREEVDHYLRNRARQGFTVIQAVALAEFEGLTVPNSYGRLPLKQTDGQYDPTQPDTDGEYSYWDHVDYAVRKAAEHGLVIGLLPTWGDKYNQAWGKGPEVFTPENARIYGRWIATRYRDCENILWIMGGDRPLTTDVHHAIVRAMAEGIREVDADHLITFHPCGEQSSYDHVGGEAWLDFHMLQTGHAVGHYDCWRALRRTLDLDHSRPALDGEPRYEDHPACFNTSYGVMWDAADTRNSAYWDVLEGACGHTYGNHCIWSFNKEPVDYFRYHWTEALTHEGAETMGFVRKLVESRPYFERRPAPDLVHNDGDLLNHTPACRGERYAFIYSPQGLPLKVNLGILPGRLILVSWYNPRTGEEKLQTLLPNRGAVTLVPPTSGRGQDWVLILDGKD